MNPTQMRSALAKIDEMLNMQTQARDLLWKLRKQLSIDSQLSGLGINLEDVTSMIKGHQLPRSSKISLRHYEHVVAIRTRDGLIVKLPIPIPPN